MKLTNNEITILINYYDGLKFDEKMHVDDLKQTYTLATQLKRYEHRISELRAELDEL